MIEKQGMERVRGRNESLNGRASTEYRMRLESSQSYIIVRGI